MTQQLALDFPDPVKLYHQIWQNGKEALHGRSP